MEVCVRRRWFATITYNTDNGPLDVMHAVDELEEIHDRVEAGPNFYAIEKIVICPQPYPGLTGRTLEELEAE